MAARANFGGAERRTGRLALDCGVGVDAADAGFGASFDAADAEAGAGFGAEFDATGAGADAGADAHSGTADATAGASCTISTGGTSLTVPER